MSSDFFAIALPFTIIPVVLVSIDFFNKSTRTANREKNIIDYMDYVKRKGKGDVVDRSIAQLLDIDKIAA